VTAILQRELRQHARAHERRLAGTRDPVDQHKAALGEAGDDLVDHPFTAEKDCPFVFLERAQARVGPLGPGDGDGRGGGH
jgi:hypothetical protein